MKKIVVIHSSPRGEQSNSTQLADYFVNFLQASDSECQIDHLNLWQLTLPAMDAVATSAKYAIMEGKALDSEQANRWQMIEKCFRHFYEADLVVIALPVWNFGVPYVLKHYIDVITQPGLCFTWCPEAGYTSLLAPRTAVIVSSSASDYGEGAGNEQDDFCLRYLSHWLKVYMGCHVECLSFAPTVHAPDLVARARQQAYEQAGVLASTMGF